MVSAALSSLAAKVRQKPNSLQVVQGHCFPTDYTFDVVTVNRVQKFLEQRQAVKSVQTGSQRTPSFRYSADTTSINIDDICSIYSQKDYIVLRYQFPRPRYSTIDEDPLQQLNRIRRRVKGQKVVLVGISHQPPSFLKRLQFQLQDKLYTKDPSSAIALTKTDQNGPNAASRTSDDAVENDFDLLLTSDTNYSLLKGLGLQEGQEIWIKPELLVSENIETDLSENSHRGIVVRDSKEQLKTVVKDLTSLGLTVSILAYMSWMYFAFKPSETENQSLQD